MWLVAAIGSALFAGATAILAKLGVRDTDSDLVTALRTVVVLVFSWVMVLVVGSQGGLASLSARSVAFLVLSGLATGASWLCYFRALSLADVSRVAPVDKSSTVLSVLLAIALFGETDGLPLKLLGTALLAAGTLLMAAGDRREASADDKSGDVGSGEKNDGRVAAERSPEQRGTAEKDPVERAAVGRAVDERAAGGRWALYAVLSAVFAALVPVLAKVGVEDVESNLATALRTGVVLVLAWAIVLARGKQRQLRGIDRREAAFIALSGAATGASWLCYYYAIQNGPVSVVVPIDKMSILVTMLFSVAVLHERLSRRALVGLVLMVAGTLVIATC